MANFTGWLRIALIVLLSLWCEQSLQDQDSVLQWPLHSDGLNDVVQWDHYSFKIKGERAFLFAGEMHYWRLPVPELWKDILQKLKAAGLNAFTFYAHWGWHAPNQDTVDFTNGAHQFDKLYDLAKEIGLYVFIRPGPYINAEANAGGFPLWLTDGKYGALRDNDTAYTEAWEPYMNEFSKLTAPHQITKGGNGLAFQIENEYGNQWINITSKTPNLTAAAYMVLLEKNARTNGIDIPLYHNNPNLNSKSWSKDFAPGLPGDVDVYGLDNYPSCWSCNLAECTSTNGPFVPFQVAQYYDHFQEVAPTMPGFMPEFQGGAYNPWGGPAGGCLNNSDFEFANLFYRNNIAEHVTAMSLYMFFGGTNWGWFAAPVTATSYDYNAPISEDRSIAAKYYETKNLALFTKVAEDLRVTNRIGNGTMYTTNAAITTVELRNPDTNAAFYVIRHTNSSSDVLEPFKMKVSTSEGNFSIPQKLSSMALSGHQSKIILTDFHFGSHSLAYSTAEVLTYSTYGGLTTLALWVPDGESGEFYVKKAKSGEVSRGGDSAAQFSLEQSGLLVAFQNQNGMTVLQFDQNLRIIVLDRTSSYPFFVPSLSLDPLASTDYNST
jgi:beta-galactosidase GanA